LGYDFDSTRGYDGEGPPRRARSATARVARRQGKDIRGSRVSADEQDRRKAAVREFVDWHAGPGSDADVLTGAPAEALDQVLVDYGQHMYRQGAAVDSFKRVLLALQSLRRALQRQLPGAWDAVSNWERDEPGGNHVPLPRRAFAAAVALCCIWGGAGGRWAEMLRALVLGWVSLARPGEMLRLRRRDLVLPSDLGEDGPPAFVVFELPKGRWSRRAAKKEHVRVDDSAAIQFLERTVGDWPDFEPLFPLLQIGGRYRTAWDALFGQTGNGLGFRCRDGDGVVPASLRAGAGCELYARTADPARFSWLARHMQHETARRYLQESAAALVLGRLPPPQRDRIIGLAAAAPRLLTS